MKDPNDKNKNVHHLGEAFSGADRRGVLVRAARALWVQLQQEGTALQKSAEDIVREYSQADLNILKSSTDQYAQLVAAVAAGLQKMVTKKDRPLGGPK